MRDRVIRASAQRLASSVQLIRTARPSLGVFSAFLIVSLVVAQRLYDSPGTAFAEGSGVASANRQSSSLPPGTIRVGVTGTISGNRYRTSDDLIRALKEASVEPVHITPDSVGVALGRIHGLVLAGGADIDPARYGEAQHPSVRPLNEDRDTLDFAVVDWALKRELPILAICLGQQELWVALGGALIQDIPSEFPSAVDHRQQHFVILETDSLLRKIYGKERLRVRSSHHQALDDKTAPPSLMLSARSPDGLVEAFEYSDPSRFLVGVAWHPEEAGESEIFNAFVSATAEFASQNARQEKDRRGNAD
jgi:putative glutamine amidotransferase